jgi:uncharacterized protein
LTSLGVTPAECDEYLLATVMTLPGWCGMLAQLQSKETDSDDRSDVDSLCDFIAVRLILDRIAVEHFARKSFGGCSLKDLRQKLSSNVGVKHTTLEQLAFSIFQIALQLKLSSTSIDSWSFDEWSRLLVEIENFNCLERRRILHLAYEANYRQAVLDGILTHQSLTRENESEVVAFQVLTCIDDREESFRRHLEEIEPNCETFGMAGFFGIAMYYKGITDSRYRPQCPVNVVPRHYVIESATFSAADDSAKRMKRRQRLGHLNRIVHSSSRTMAGGVLTGLFGSLATAPLIARVLLPNITARIRHSFGHVVRPRTTELHIERLSKEPGPTFDSFGFSHDEMANMVLGTLRCIGLTQKFSKLVILLGHGSSSLNNPHESAYHCGACSGGRGGPNARAFARMANDPDVRRRISQQGVDIPKEVHFVGGFHNTCNDRIDFFDLDHVPNSHRPLFREAESKLMEAAMRNAHERCRRFESASLRLTFEEAKQHVEARSEDLSQARPEYNHATNALCLVGQRSWSKGLFLDRRSFLVSYDPKQDDSKGSILESIMRAVIPVCGGISLEYYFSTVDPEVYGCGSKLPHNVTSLVGVMTGAASDLRPGLSAQMVEIHEPMRLLYVVQTQPWILQRIIEENEVVKQMVTNDWVQIAVFNRDTKQIEVLQNIRSKDSMSAAIRFNRHLIRDTVLPSAISSKNWYQGHRNHLSLASISKGAE